MLIFYAGVGSPKTSASPRYYNYYLHGRKLAILIFNAYATSEAVSQLFLTWEETGYRSSLCQWGM